MNIEEIIELQREFDSEHGTKKKSWDWAFHKLKTADDLLEALDFEIISILGEVGEAANKLKKILRSKMYGKSDLTKEKIRFILLPEIVDILIYVIKMTITLDINIAKEYPLKLQKNRKRFRKFNFEYS